MKKKILLYGDVSLNIVDGSSVWLASLAKLLSNDKNNVVDILLKAPIRRSVLSEELVYRNNISFLEGGEFVSKNEYIDERNIVKVMTKIDELRDYSCIIVRGFEVVQAIVKNDNLASKLIPYITNFCHSKDLISRKEKDSLSYIYNRVNQFFVQTVQMGDYLKDILNIDGEKFKILNPMIFKDSVKPCNKIKKSIVYAGKIAKDWNILELIEIMDRLYKIDSEITLHFIGDKFNPDMYDYTDEILTKFKNSPNIKFYGSRPKSETTKIINSCELGYSFRSRHVDNDESLELSSKVLEYCFCNVPLILRKTKMHTDVLGEDYPLYAESVDECVEKIVKFFSHDSEFKDLTEKLHQKVERFSPENVYKNIFSALEMFPSKKMRLLITGHDLKFIKQLFPYFEKEFELKVQEYPEYTHLDVVESKKLIQNCDIVWCEWLLLNAQWYSMHIYSFQKLYIRAHKFEISKNYGTKVKWQNVDKLITVAYYWMEHFIEKFRVSRHKVTVINNFIDVDSYSDEKEENYKYNIGMIGFLPKLKGFSRAVDVLKILKETDSRYKLYLAGKRPEEFANTWNIPEQKQYYLDTYQKIKDLGLEDSVIYTGWIKTSDFLKKIGYVLSLSDRTFPESFHVAPFEGMASGGVGLAIYWEGIEYVYPEELIEKSPEDIAERIIKLNQDDQEYKKLSQMGKEFVKNNYDLPIIWTSIFNVID